jgi:NAD(P)-dependent dehydrogenase (short-subunit alcohol dehydrogenase family)
VNFKGLFFLTQKLLPLMSMAARSCTSPPGVTCFVNPDSIAYATLKGAVEVFTRDLAHDLGPRNINVNAVAPGAVQTDFSGGVVRDNPALNELVSKTRALGRPGVPEDLGQMIIPAVGRKSLGNAQRIEVSGGMRL